jgi:stage II sporulation protein R
MKNSLVCRKALTVFALFISAFLVWCAGVEQKGEELSEKVIRLHILADSDEDEAQRLKLMARDSVLAELKPLLDGCPNAAAAAAVIEENIESIKKAAKTALESNGCFLPVSAAIKKEAFDERHYGSFALPSGKYTALRLVIGRGGGHNWWCVVFPPLCLSAALKEDQDVLAVLSDEEVELIAGDGCTIRFKILELYNLLKEKLGIA